MLRYMPEHQFLSDDEAFEVGVGFRRDHPHRLRMLSRVLGWGDLDDDDAVRQFVHAIPSWRSGRRPPSPQVDRITQHVAAYPAVGAASNLATGCAFWDGCQLSTRWHAERRFGAGCQASARRTGLSAGANACGSPR